jgi:glucose/arabinose dehydrogenase
LAFAPDFAKSGLFYVYYTAGDGAQQVVEYHAAGPDQADPNSARVVLRMPDPRPNDNGGDLEFGPDGLLYIGTGDGGDLVNQPPPGNSQDLGSLFGKLLRIDPRAQGSLDYTIPTGNPFLHRAGARPEIYSYGLRNPWRFSFDRKTGAIVIGDVGGSRSEEIDYAAKGHARGANYGWRLFEGNLPYEKGSAHGLVKPVLTHSHSKGWCAISGGYVVRDPSLPALAGRYVYSDLCEGHIWAVRLHSGGAKGDGRLHVRSVPTVDSFGEDARGRVYVVSHNGPVYRLAAR